MQYRFVDAVGHLGSEMRVDELSELRREVFGWENEEGHCAFEVGEEGRVGWGTRCEVGGRKLEGGGDGGMVRGGTVGGIRGGRADEFNELQAEEREVQGGVGVEELYARNWLAGTGWWQSVI
jgi:hypothetical protein